MLDPKRPALAPRRQMRKRRVSGEGIIILIIEGLVKNRDGGECWTGIRAKANR
jgi:hypothetical protein